jgi:hypothetical protein
MTDWGVWYWRVFNLSVRALGLVALWSGAVFIVWGTRRVLELEFILIDQAPALAILPAGLLVATLGWAILRVPAYRPDLGDVLWQFDSSGAKTRRASPARRSWWTGDRLRASRRTDA